MNGPNRLVSGSSACAINTLRETLTARALTMLLWSAIVAIVASASLRADETSPQPSAPAADSSTDDIDAQLRKELDGDLLEGLEEMPAENASDPAAGDASDPATEPNQPSAAERKVDEQLLEELGGDESTADDDDPLAKVGKQMREVERMLARRQAGGDTQTIENQIVDGLSDLLAEMAKKRKSMRNQQGNQQQKRQRSQAEPQGKPGEQQPGDPGGSDPAADSTARTGRDRVEKADPANRRDLLKDLWGHLPERVQEQMLQASMEEFMPKYQFLIEEYFKRLIELKK